MKALITAVLMLLTLCQQLFSQTGAPSGPTNFENGPNENVIPVCGYTPQFAYQSNTNANQGNRTTGNPPPQVQSFTPQGSFPVNQIITCGKFRIYYEDFIQTPAAGFNDPNLGAVRRSTLCAVLNYIENSFTINVNGVTDFIDLYIDQSWTSSNPAPSTIGYLGAASPYYDPATYGVTPGYYSGFFYSHSISGTDPFPGQYDAHIIMNFHQAIVNNIVYTCDYWDDYTNTSALCRYDLYSVLLHEIGHCMGFASSVQEDASLNAVCGVPNNSFTLFDQHFLYHSTTPCNQSSLVKVVTGTSPSINPSVSSLTNELRSNAIWARNTTHDKNHPIYSGTLDPSYAINVPSLCSHLSANILALTAQSQFAPGFQSNYVMGAGITFGQRKRLWTNEEYRMFLTMGYTLNSTFNLATSINGIDPNGWLLNNNSPAYRTNCSIPMTSYNTPYNFMELLPQDFTAFTNNNTPANLTASQLTINIASLSSIADGQGDPISIMPNSLFGIRGVSTNANNHGALTINAAGTQVIYTPEPGYRGLAQFGFYLWDGHERGALRIVTINVLPGSYTVAPGNELVINGGFEDGTEVRQTNNLGIENSSLVDWVYESVFAGQNLSGAHPYNFYPNNWNLGGGSVMYKPWYMCFMGSNPTNGFFGTPQVEWDINNSPSQFDYPIPTTLTSPNERYNHFQREYNYSVLRNPVSNCNVYQFQCDLNFEKTNFQIGQTFVFQLQFVNSVSPTVHSVVHYSLPVYVTVNTLTPDTWQRVTVNFQYCGTPSSFMNLLVQGIIANPPPVTSGTGSTSPTGITTTYTNLFIAPMLVPLIDNISLKQISPTPALTISATANPTTQACAGPVTVSAVPQSYIPCNATYTWQPGNIVGSSITTTIQNTTTFTVNVTSTSCPQTASTTVTSSVTNPGVSWPKNPSGNGNESFQAVTKASNGDIIAAGYFTNNIQFPGLANFTTTPNNEQLFVVRYSPNCGTIWAVQLGNANAGETVYDIALDANGDIFITGGISATTTFGTTTITGPAAYIVKLRGTNGTVMAARGSSVSSGAFGKAITISSAGDVYVVGQYQTNIAWTPLTAVTSVGSNDVFVMKINNTLATPAWNSSIGSTTVDNPGGIGISTFGDLYVAANITGNLPLPYNLTNTGAGTNDIFIGRFNIFTGAYIGTSGRMEGSTSGACTLNDMIVEGTGDVYFTGSFVGTFTTLTSANTNAMICKWTSNTLGNNWARQMGSTGNVDAGRALCFDGAGNIYVTGAYSGAASFTGFTPASQSTGSVFVVKLSTSNVPSFSATSTNVSPNSCLTNCITALSTGDAFVGGNFNGTISFGSFNLTATNINGYLTRISGTGTYFRIAAFDETENENNLIEANAEEASVEAKVFSKVFPNPSTQILYVHLEKEGEAEVSVYDAFGKIVFNTKYTNTINNDLMINLNEQANGLYFIRISINGQIENHKIILQKN